MQRSITEQALLVKDELFELSTKAQLNAQSQRDDAYHNPLALISKVGVSQSKYSKEAIEFIKKLESTAKLIVSPENLIILRNYFTERAKINDNLGVLYQSMEFEDFLIRLFSKRYKQVYLDGRVVKLRDEAPIIASISVPPPQTSYPILANFFTSKYYSNNIYNFNYNYNYMERYDANHLRMVGTEKDYHGYYREYLTLEEMMLSPLILPQVVSTVIGTSNRNDETQWDVLNEFYNAIDVACFSYPAGAEFRDGNTLHYDLYNIAIAARPSNYIYPPALNEPLNAAIKAIYGETASYKDFKAHPEKYIHIEVNAGCGTNECVHFSMLSFSTFQTKPGYNLITNYSDPLLIYLNNSHETLFIDLREIPYEAKQTLYDFLKHNTNNLKKIFAAKDKITQAIQTYHHLPTTLHNGQTSYFLNKNAYLARTKNLLKLVLTSADREMKQHSLGQTFQLKGLGLGAFAFAGNNNQLALESLYREALKATLTEIELFHINSINLINLPSVYGKMKGVVPSDSLAEEYTFNNIKVMSSRMDPTTVLYANQIGEIGGTVFCGDSASMAGNEGNCGLHRDSSDDPAQQYALLNPYILCPQRNTHFLSEDAIYICDPQKAEFVPYSHTIVNEEKVATPVLPVTQPQINPPEVTSIQSVPAQINIAIAAKIQTTPTNPVNPTIVPKLVTFKNPILNSVYNYPRLSLYNLPQNYTSEEKTKPSVAIKRKI